MKGTKTTSKKFPSKDSFLETFRDLGNDLTSSTVNDLFKNGSQDLRESIFPFLKQEEKGSQKDYSQEQAKTENQYRSHVSRIENVHRQEQVLFTREQRETRQQVDSLQQEIKKLAKATSDLASEAKEAESIAMQETPAPGTYHLNFFEQLRKVIASLRSQIQESSLWLSSWNAKAQKKNYYWGQFKKSGSKFLLSSDRSVATQAG